MCIFRIVHLSSAEYRGLTLGLEAALRHRITALHIQGDSKLVLNQVFGMWKVNTEHLIEVGAEGV